jgi:hypothetical protein
LAKLLEAVVMDEIYVQIPAYRDQELSKTLLELYTKARHPERLRTAVVWQRSEEETLSPEVFDLPNLEIEEVPYQQSQGCNWARSLLQGRWRGEPYTMLLDSHQRFVSDWDLKILEMYRQLQESGARKPLLTAYLPSYEPGREPGGRKKRPYKIYALGREEGVLTKLTSRPIPFWTTLRQPIEADFISLHFLFTAGEFNREVPFDPEIYFFGDEVLTSLRAFTSGYDLFHPHRIIGWHCYERTTRVAHWNDHETWYQRHRFSLNKLRKLFQGRHKGTYGLGRTRTLRQYEDHIMMKLVEV